MSEATRDEKRLEAHRIQAEARERIRARERAEMSDRQAEILAMPLPPREEMSDEALKILRSIVLNEFAENKDRVAAAKAMREELDVTRRFYDLFPSPKAAALWLIAETPRLLALAGVEEPGHDEPARAAIPGLEGKTR